MPTAKRVAIYARVSTDEGAQNPETQLRQLRRYAKFRKFKVVEEFVDYATGRSEQRTHYKRLFEAVRKGKVDVVLVWRYDRFARSTQALVFALKEFHSLGVDFISFQENIDTTTPQGELVFTIMASIAQFESSLIGERTKAGMERARAQGKRTSRPLIPEATKREIVTRAKKGISINKIRKELGIGYGTAYKYVKEVR